MLFLDMSINFQNILRGILLLANDKDK